MRNLALLLTPALLLGLAGPASASSTCDGGACAKHHRRVYHGRAGCCCPTPPGWGFYLRQKFRHDQCSPPLVVIDELGAVTLVRGR